MDIQIVSADGMIIYMYTRMHIHMYTHIYNIYINSRLYQRTLSKLLLTTNK